MITKFEL